jgi:DNA-binding LacI/PurR family transcriptional regulator
MGMNIGEIARRAGVSRSTVSYTLTGKRAVSEATRRRILDVIDELNYRPNASARALKEGRTRTVGLVIPPAQQRLTEMQLGFVASVVEAAAKVDLDVLVSPSGGDHDRSFERILTARRVDGVILMEIRLEDARVARLQRSGLPFVTIGRTAEPVTRAGSTSTTRR